jgi:hypothetical protein
LSSEDIVIGDLDGSGVDDVVIDFGTGYGVWIFQDGQGWVHGHDLSPDQMIIANLN